MSPSEFAAKWLGVTTTERASAQTHFNDLCRMLGVAAPHDADPDGEWYAFEKGVEKTVGGDGWADVWKRGHFGWEYKGKHRDLAAAYDQLLNYRESLENPPLLVVCDLDRFEVHTNFTNTAKQVYRFSLADLRDHPEEPLRILRAVMSNPEALRPQVTREEITQAAAGRFADIAKRLQERGHDPEQVAHFLNRVLFCFFAEDAGLLPGRLLTRLVEGARRDPPAFTEGLRDAVRPDVARGRVAALRHGPRRVVQRRPVRLRRRATARGRRAGAGARRRRPRLVAGGAGRAGHALRARARPGEARATGRALHGPRQDRHGRRPGGDGAAASASSRRCARRSRRCSTGGRPRR